MDRKIIVDLINQKLEEKKMSAEYLLQLNKVIKYEEEFIKDFSKEKWKEYFIFKHRDR